ncbi:hypothetical protein [Sporosarcina koreensis]|uniref:MarR family transcriptional regulator n=1 Tax=Sporosarcina koreensis TaxID=334735 RepID=A0ABW0TWX5_9BACL
METSKWAIVNIETGEIINDVASFRTRKQQVSYEKIKRFQNYKLMDSRRFVQCYHDPIKQVSSNLSLSECGAIMKLLVHVQFNSGGLLQKDGEPLKQRDLELILGRSKRQVATIISSLEYASIIKATKNGRSKLFYINEKFHMKGKRLKKIYFTKLLSKKLKEIAEELRLEELGFLYKVLPYFHFQTCALAHNPNEEEEDRIKYMNRRELSTAVGYTEDNVTLLVKKLRNKGLVMSINSCGNVLYYIHPDLMFRQTNDGNSERFNALRALFEAHKVNANNRTHNSKG